MVDSRTVVVSDVASVVVVVVEIIGGVAVAGAGGTSTSFGTV